MSKVSKTAATADTSLDFEQSMEDLDTLVEQLEQGDLSLDASLEAFEQGIKLTRECQQQLASAEQKVALLIDDNNALKAVDFDANND